MIRPACEEDVAEVLELWADARTLPPSVPDTPETVREALDSLLVYEEDGRIVGTVIAGWDGWRGNMYRLAVARHRRRRGIGLALVRAAEDRLRLKGARRITAIVALEEEHAEALWTAAGYERDSQVSRYVRTV